MGQTTRICNGGRVVMLLPVQSHVRFWKRAEGLERTGARVRVLSFERPWYEGKAPDKEWASLGTLEHRNYLARIPVLLRAVSKIRRELEPDDVVYAFGLDVLAVGWLATLGRRTAKLVLEVGDIRGAMLGSSFSAKMLRTIERFLLRRTDVVVCTTEAFVNDYYRGMQHATHPHYLVIENRLDPTGLADPSEAAHEPGDALTIGYFGVLRCPRSWEVLRRLAETPGDRIRVLVRGIPFGVPTVEQDVAASKNMTYGGPYVSPDDLVSMYSRVDMIWVAYPFTKQNHRWARTNRSYEAGYFRKPIIAQRGTGDGTMVDAAGVGLLIDLDDLDRTVAAVREVTYDKLAEWRTRLAAMDRSNFVLTDEHERLCAALFGEEAIR